MDSKKSLLGRALSFARPHRLTVAVILALTLSASAMSALEPLVMKYIFDGLGENGTLEAVLFGLGGLVLLAVFREVGSGISNWLSWRTRLRIHYTLLGSTVEKLHRLPLGVQREEGVGSIMTRLDRSIQGFIGAISEISFNVLPAFFYLLLAVVAMIKLDWRMTILVLIFAPMPAIIAAFAAPNQTRREQTLLDRWASIYSRFNEVLSGIMTVRSFAMEDFEKNRFLTNVSKVNRIVIKGIGFDTRVGAAQNFVVTGARIAAIGFGGWLVLRGEATVGTLVAFLGYVGGMFGPVQGLTGIYRTLRTARVSLEQIFTILDREDHLKDHPEAQDIETIRGKVDFDRVTFSYEGNTQPVLEDFDLSVQPGEMIAIVGPSGAGKTTLMGLLQRFYDPDQGSVRIDGQDLRMIKQKSVRKRIGVVLQDALLFNESIRDNIAYGRPSATFKEIEDAARAAHAHEFITKLDKRYDTMAGERGTRFSAGERQRIAIARALLKNPPLLVLDEATSALDAESETKVQAALENLVYGRTTFVIAHRLSTVVNADRIIVLKDGQIHECGRHEDLVQSGGYYA
ncbi:MAG: ABC transporter ATP-binding protein, partial [Desulfovibrionales bacterium]